VVGGGGRASLLTPPPMGRGALWCALTGGFAREEGTWLVYAGQRLWTFLSAGPKRTTVNAMIRTNLNRRRRRDRKRTRQSGAAGFKQCHRDERATVGATWTPRRGQGSDPNCEVDEGEGHNTASVSPRYAGGVQGSIILRGKSIAPAANRKIASRNPTRLYAES